jgi:hypothetical protein
MVTSRSTWSARAVFLLLSLTLLVGMGVSSWGADITAQDCLEAAVRSNPAPPSCHGRRVLETTIIKTQQGQPVCRVEKVEYVCPKPHEGIRLSHQLEYFLLGDGYWSADTPLHPPADVVTVPPPDPLWTFLTTSPSDNGINDVMSGFLQGLGHVDKPSQMRNNLNYNRGYLVGAIVNVGSQFVPIRAAPRRRTAALSLQSKRNPPNAEFKLNEYTYRTDAEGRVVEVEGDLRLESASRNGTAQRTVGKDDGRLADDQGGHLIGAQFGGSGGKANLVPMDKGINDYHKGEWGQMEKNWAANLKAGKSVTVNIQPVYTDSTIRPAYFNIRETINGVTRSFRITNPGA